MPISRSAHAHTSTQPVETYLKRMREIRAGAATKETSYYGALENLLNGVGRGLKPRVVCNGQLRNQGADHPDFGLYVQNQLRGETLRDGQLNKPERGVVEVKGLADDAWKTPDTAQVSKYWGAYRLVLVTNYRDFLLLGEDSAGRPAKLEAFSLAGTEGAFWQAASTPRRAAEAYGRAFLEYLTRVLSYRASLSDPKEVAWFLASYARDALDRVERRGELPALQQVRTALEDALGIHFEGERGTHFFHSTLVQTLFYGVFSAWVLWAQEPNGSRRFDWRLAGWHLRVPMIGALFNQIATRQRLEPLGLIEVLDWTANVLNRVDRDSFFSRFEEEEAVIYFYEPFLQAFDPKLRDQLGVWYTPKEVVRYMVERVDRALCEELDIADGLAAERVHVLDPCCGTGAYLTEVLRKIDARLVNRGLGALKGQQVKQAALSRIYGFEIMPAPFVVAHLQIGRLLQGLQAPLSDSERGQVYLTNALTGWVETGAEKQIEAFPEFEQERERAREVKRERPILVILGNPPYYGYAGAAIDEERDLVEPYRRVSARLGERCKPEGQGLNDPYVRFFRMAERRIVEGTGHGIVSFITNFRWLDGGSHPGMREHFLRVFDHIRIDSLNGDSRKTGKLTPDGRPDPSIFSTGWNREGIQVGTAITTLIRTGRKEARAEVGFRDLWGQGKWQELLDTAALPANSLYDPVEPIPELCLPFRPGMVASGYFAWPSLINLFPTFFPGVKTSRDEFLVSIDEQPLHARLADYFDPALKTDEMGRRYASVMASTQRYNAEEVRNKLRGRDSRPGEVVRYAYRPFDLRWLYWVGETKLLDERRPEYRQHVFDGNIAILFPQRHRRSWSEPPITSQLADINVVDGSCTVFPLLIREVHAKHDHPRVKSRPNLTRSAQDYLCQYGIQPLDLFRHVVAVLHAPSYRQENHAALHMDWPRLPLPDDMEMLRASAALGEELIRLLDPESEAPGVTTGSLRPELAALSVPTKRGGAGLGDDDMMLTTNWGYRDSRGAVMAGGGRTEERVYSDAERAAVEAGAATLGPEAAQAFDLLGGRTLDVYLNDRAYWANVPAKVWTYKLGGYQVLKKWLSYREQRVLGRPLRFDEVLYFAQVARRIAAILLMGPVLDANYRQANATAVDWRTFKEGERTPRLL